MENVQYLLVEGGAGAAEAFLDAGLVDRLLIYRARREVGGDGPCVARLSRTRLAGSPKWRLGDLRKLGNAELEVYEHS